MPKRWRLGIGSREEEWLETIILKNAWFFSSTISGLPPFQCSPHRSANGAGSPGTWSTEAHSLGWRSHDHSAAGEKGLGEDIPEKVRKKACWFCVPKDLLCINCICMYGWTKTVAETIHRLKSVVCFLFGAVRSSQKMGSRLAFSFCAKRCTNWHSKISQCRCSLFHSARLRHRDSQKRMPWLSYHPAWNI